MIILKQLANISIKESLQILEKIKDKCLIIVNKKNKLIGTLTDGDLRRAIINGANLNSRIKKYIQRKSIYLKLQDKKFLEKNNYIREKVLLKKSEMKNQNVDLIPIVDKNFKLLKIVNVKFYEKVLKKENPIFKNTPVLIMAGGEGTRLGKFSNYFPKPLLPYESSTVIEKIISNFQEYSIKKFYISVRYKKNLIKSYLKENLNRKLTFFEEKKPLGTAGAIKFLKGKIKKDFFIINCDTVLNINLEKFYEFHKKNNFIFTLVAASKNFQLSYGSCQINKNGELKKIEEKPNFNYLVNVGLYLAKIDIIKNISTKKPMQMDMLIKKIKAKGGKVGVFAIDEGSWTDTGLLREL